MALLPAVAIGAAGEVDHHVPACGLPAILGCSNPLVDVTLHDGSPRSGGHGSAEPFQQGKHGHERPATQAPGRQFATPCRLVCGTPAEAEQASGFLDGNRDTALQSGQRGIEGRNFGQVGTSL